MKQRLLPGAVSPMVERTSDGEHAALRRCLSCDGDGYLAASTLTKPIHCTCHVGVLARSMDADPLDDRKALLWQQATRAARGGESDG